jgi:uncharacterized protein
MPSELRTCVAIIAFNLWLSAWSSYAQIDSISPVQSIVVIGRPLGNSIQLRWAPTTSSVWSLANTHGYTIKRFTLARNNKLLATPEEVTLNDFPIKPAPEEEWPTNISDQKYYAIAAQALFGDRFEVDVGKTDVFTIVNKVREKEQRFGFALFAADMSTPVATLSGLAFTDRNVKNGEKYVYRVSVKGFEAYTGSLFLGGDDEYELPILRGLEVMGSGKYVSIKWNKSRSEKYSAYIVERSTDGKTFTSISDTPLITLSRATDDARYEYASDSIPVIERTYYYRVRGLSPFGETGPPSDVFGYTSTPDVSDVPHIESGESIDNKSIVIAWTFPEKSNSGLKGFHVERSRKSSVGFEILTSQSPLSPASRSFEDKTPLHINYYRIAAATTSGRIIYSPTYLVQLVDSFPPVAPVGLRSTIDESGNVEISWEPNNESDIFGYRVYKGNNAAEELAQVTKGPISANRFRDWVNLNTLNKELVYQVMAIDNSQNHSPLSDLIVVKLPDKVPPQPAVFLPIKNDSTGVVLSWVRSGSQDVAYYEVFEKAQDKEEWRRLKVIQSTTDTIYHFKPEMQNKRPAVFTVVAVDQSGLESEPTTPIKAVWVDNKLKPPIEWKPFVLVKEEKRVVLSWKYSLEGVSAFRIFRAVNDGPLVLYKIVSGVMEFSDKIENGRTQHYHVAALFTDNSISRMSDVLTVAN